MRVSVLALLFTALLSVGSAANDDQPLDAIWVLDLEGAVGPAPSDYLVRGIERAGEAQARLIILRMDTPGGLDGAMRDIVESI